MYSVCAPDVQKYMLKILKFIEKRVVALLLEKKRQEC